MYYYKQKDYAKAKELCEEAIESWNKLKGVTIKETADWAIDNNIARCKKMLSLIPVQLDSKPSPKTVMLPERAKNAFEEYKVGRKFIPFKAFAVDPQTGGWGRSWGHTRPAWAINRAMKACSRRNEACELYAIGDTIVFGLSEDKIDATSAEYFSSLVKAPSMHSAGQLLSPEEVERYVIGKTLNITDNTGRRFIVKVFKDGTMHGQQLDPEGSLTGKTDTGTWRVDAGKFCLEFTKWEGGISVCYSVVKDGDTFRLYSDGDFLAEFTIQES